VLNTTEDTLTYSPCLRFANDTVSTSISRWNED